MPLPDLFLARVLGTIRFGPSPGWRVGGHVPVAFMGMWAIVFIPTLLCARSKSYPILKAAACALSIFMGSELLAGPLDMWHATDKVSVRIGSAAVYVLAPEAILGGVLAAVAPLVYTKSFSIRFITGFGIMLLYTGALAICYLAIET